jgi:hypothetical protein
MPARSQRGCSSRIRDQRVEPLSQGARRLAVEHQPATFATQRTAYAGVHVRRIVPGHDHRQAAPHGFLDHVWKRVVATRRDYAIGCRVPAGHIRHATQEVYALGKFHFSRKSLQLWALRSVADDRQFPARVGPGQFANGVIE